MSEREILAERIAKAFFDENTYCLQQMKPFTQTDGSVMLNGGARWTYGSFVERIASSLEQSAKEGAE